MISLQVLGQVGVTVDGRDAGDVLTHAKRVALLTYLALARPRGLHRRDHLYALLWPDADTERARNSLRQAIHQLRRTLGTEAVLRRGDEELGLAQELVTCDAVAMEQAVTEGRHAAAVELYQGDLLPGFHVADASDFSDWLDAERARLRELAAKAAWVRAEDLARSGDPAGAARIARRAAAWQPFDEPSQRRLIDLLDRLGDRAGALRAYDAFAERLRVELEAEPSEQTAALIREMRSRTPVLPPPPPWAVAAGEPAAPPPHAAASPVRKGRPAVLYVAGILTVLVVAAMVREGILDSAAAPDPTRVTVFPFTVSGPAELAYLGEGMVDLLSAKLDLATGLQGTDPRSVMSAIVARRDSPPPDLVTYARIARRLGAGRFIMGDLVQVESGGRGTVQLNATLHDVADGRTISTATVTGSAGSVFELVDALGGRLLASVTAGRDTSLTRLAALTTQSLPALKAFLEGERALRAGRDAQAAASFRDAVALDTGFALAQYRLAVMSTWVNVPDMPDPRAIAAAAARHAQRLTPLARDLLTAYQAYKDLRADSAERLYLHVTGAHPENVEAWFMLGEVRFHYNPFRGRPPDEALPAFQRVLALDPNNSHAALHLARLAAGEGRFAELDSLSRDYLARHRDAERVLEMRALLADVGEDQAARAAVVAAVHDAGDFLAMSILQAAIVYAQNLDAAAELAPRFAGSLTESRTTVYARRSLSTLPLAGGQLGRDPAARLLGSNIDDDWLLEEQALVAAEPLFAVPQARIAALRDRVAARRPYPSLSLVAVTADTALGPIMQAYLLGLLSIRLGDTTAAVGYAGSLERWGDPRVQHIAAASLAVGIRAEFARTRGNLPEALRQLDRFAYEVNGSRLNLPSHWSLRERLLRAEVLHALGRDAEARPLYESFLDPYGQMYMAVAQLRLGEILERQRQPQQAAFHYGRFLTMWQHSDPELQPLVERARAARAHVVAARN